MSIFSEKFSIEKQEFFKNELAKLNVIINPKQYAFWEVRHPDFVATFYTSGKFVIQGKKIETALQILNLQASEILKKDNPEFELIKEPHIGTDESGKGDFFGPLVIAGVYVDDENKKLFEDLGIRDSKTLNDDKILKMALQIQKNSKYSVIAISNSKYNELYKNFKNLNKLLAWGHARVIENILEKTDCKVALSDKFGDESLIKNALMKKGQQIKLEQRVRGEADIAVAAASVLARATFVQKVQSMENFYGCKFPKGCSNKVIESAKIFIEKYSYERLTEVSKTHFKTYSELC